MGVSGASAAGAGNGVPAGSGHGHAAPHESSADAAEFWESHYGSADRVWSGKVNETLAAVVSELNVGRSLDLGSGEGGDVLWLAQQGWRASGIDISSIAVERAAEAAVAAGVDAEHARFVCADLTALTSEELVQQGLNGMDLVTASFFQSPLELDRGAILRAAAALVAVGGHLVIVSHAAPPSWAEVPAGMEHKFPTPAEELEALALSGDEWRTLRADLVVRDIVAPDGQPATIDDTLVVLQRIAE